MSVIIPAFNASETLGETLESVIVQSRPDWEAVIVNDGSTDQTLPLAQSWCQRDARIRLVSRPNKGLAASRNDGAAIASAPWLLFLDADDLIEPSFVDAMLGGAGREPQADVIYCGFTKFLPDGRRDNPFYPPGQIHFESLSRHNVVQPNGLLIRREVFMALGGFDTAFSASADWDMWLRIARTGARFAGIGESLALYRLSHNQMSRGAEALFRESCRVIDIAHGPDPRVSHPHRAFASGAPRYQRGVVVLRSAAWCAGVMIGAGADAEPFLDSLEIDAASGFQVRDVMSVLPGSLPHGACLLYEDWPRLWARHWRQVCGLFELLARFSNQEDFAETCLATARRNFSGIPGWIDYSAARKFVARS